MRCIRCGNENPATNRFCGTCGASLALAAPGSTTAVRSQAGSQTTATREAVAPVASGSVTSGPIASGPVTSAPRALAPVREEVPAIAGPSFLGLNTPPAGVGRSNLSRDAHSGRTSGNLDYLLEDEEEKSGGGAGKIFVILMALALVVIA